ncbi:MAG: hypothetical protein JG718_08900 [Candidatus Thiothrix moscowensis]|nr:hypothetical protein [Candidatus Thiothrix moscowensis]
MANNLILVEGADDKWFFTVLLEKIQLTANIYPPAESDCGIEGNGIDNLLDSIPVLLKQLSTKQLDRLAIIIDADTSTNNFGFEARRNQIKSIIEPFGYHIPEQKPEQYQGELFSHSRGFAPVGLWIMPNHCSDGMLEDFILPCIEHLGRKEVLDIVGDSLADIKSRETLTAIRFSDAHESKVRLSTWLDWQKKPNNCRQLSPACALKEGWLKPEHANIKALTHWLQQVFQ